MMNVEWDAFDLTKSAKQLNWCTYSSLGSVINHNTMESFKSFDKVSGYVSASIHTAFNRPYFRKLYAWGFK